MTTETLEQTAERIVRQEVRACVSYLVATLAQHDAVSLDLRANEKRERPLAELVEQAFELAAPIPDYEEAAIQAGWTDAGKFWTRPEREGEDQGRESVGAGRIQTAADAEDACQFDNLDPIDRDVFEHWIVSDWLADKLIERGEKVDKDFAGLCVWARTTTGQMIAMDSVIEAIARQIREAR